MTGTYETDGRRIELLLIYSPNMTCLYTLRVSGADREDVTEVLGRAPSEETGDWALTLREGPDDAPVRFVEEFLAVVAGKFELLAGIGVQRAGVSVWFLYEYEGQCNMEFSPEHLRALGAAGITLCVSCWERA